jgi:hypothetical protein
VPEYNAPLSQKMFLLIVTAVRTPITNLFVYLGPLKYGHTTYTSFTQIRTVVHDYHEKLHNLYSSPSVIRRMKSRRMRWVGHVARVVEKMNAYRILMGNRPLGRPRRTWLDNIKIDREMER